MASYDELTRLRKLYELKRVYRACTVDTRKENSAEHSWSCLLLADYFLSIAEVKNNGKSGLDRLRVYELLMYHDVVEIEAGDTPIETRDDRQKAESEARAAEILKNKLPLGEKFIALFQEFEEQKTPESRFARAIDKLDANIHELDAKPDWKGWSEQKVRQYFEPAYADFPEIKRVFRELLRYVGEHGYFNQ